MVAAGRHFQRHQQAYSTDGVGVNINCDKGANETSLGRSFAALLFDLYLKGANTHRGHATICRN